MSESSGLVTDIRTYNDSFTTGVAVSINPIRVKETPVKTIGTTYMNRYMNRLCNSISVEVNTCRIKVRETLTERNIVLVDAVGFEIILPQPVRQFHGLPHLGELRGWVPDLLSLMYLNKFEAWQVSGER